MSFFAKLRTTPTRKPYIGASVAIAVWIFALAAGFRVLVKYELKAGASAVAPTAWLPNPALPFDGTRMNLVMFAHPRCPCSRASMAELAVIMTRANGQLAATVCFIDPDAEGSDWTQTSLWHTAKDIPGVKVVADRNGAVAHQFASATSGQVFLFDRKGQRLFAGGITGARGHEGENRGRTLVIALARGELCSPETTPVFGCSLEDPKPLTTEESQ